MKKIKSALISVFYKNGLDEIVKEPLGGAHSERDETFKTVAATILKHYQVLKNLSPKDLVKERMDKYAAMGEFES